MVLDVIIVAHVMVLDVSAVTNTVTRAVGVVAHVLIFIHT